MSKWNWSYACDSCEPEADCGYTEWSDIWFDTEEEAREAEGSEHDIPRCWKPFYYKKERD